MDLTFRQKFPGSIEMRWKWLKRSWNQDAAISTLRSTSTALQPHFNRIFTKEAAKWIKYLVEAFLNSKKNMVQQSQQNSERKGHFEVLLRNATILDWFSFNELKAGQKALMLFVNLRSFLQRIGRTDQTAEVWMELATEPAAEIVPVD